MIDMAELQQKTSPVALQPHKFDKAAVFAAFKERAGHALEGIDLTRAIMKKSAIVTSDVLSTRDTSFTESSSLVASTFNAIHSRQGNLAEGTRHEVYACTFVQTGALVSIGKGDEVSVFLIVSGGEGIELHIDGVEITAISPTAPILKEMMGKEPGQTFSHDKITYAVLAVQ
jgi:hypothetical protein